MPFTKDRSFLMSFRRASHLLGMTDPVDNVDTTSKWILRSRTGVSNPHWREQVAKCQNATTAMSGIYEIYTQTPTSVTLIHLDKRVASSQSPKYINLYWGDFVAFSSPTNFIDWSPLITTAVAKNRAMISYLKHVRAVNTAFGGMTFAGELRESLAMIRRPAQNLRNLIDSYLSDIKRAKHRKPKRWKKELSGLWLEYAFGWIPLISDINAANAAWNRKTEDRYIPVSGFGLEEKPVAVGIGNSVSHHGLYYITSYRKNEKAAAKYKGIVRQNIATTNVERLSQWGFSPAEFAPTAWELLPWSFLIDYFTNIGDVISSACTSTTNVAWTNLSTVVYQYLDTDVREDIAGNKSYWSRDVIGDHYISCSGSFGSSKHERRTVTRSSGASLFTPSLSFELPSILQQFCNMTALFAQVSAGIHPQHRPGRH